MQDKRKLFILSLFLGILLWSASVGAESPTDGKNPFASNPEAIAAGKTVFEGVCAGYCHATEKSMRPGRCPNLFDCEWKHGSGDEQVFHALSDGVPKTEMVGFKGKIPDDMLWKVIAYLRSASKCKKNETPAAAAAH